MIIITTRKQVRYCTFWVGFVAILVFSGVVISEDGIVRVKESSATDANGVDREAISVVVGESTIIKTPWPTIRVAVTDPKIANVQVLTPDEILLQGTSVGATDLILWGQEENQIWRRKVKTSIDTKRIATELAEMFPNSTLEVSQLRDVLVVKGSLRKSEQAQQLRGYLEKTGLTYLDMTSIAGVRQVQLQVRVAEVSRTALRTMGINAFITDDDFFGAARVGSEGGGTLVPSIDIGPPEGTVAGNNTSFVFGQDVTAGSLVTLFAGFPRADFELFLQALAENQYLRLLANPTLVALSGEKAEFLAGGEFPIPVVQGAGGGASGGTSVTIQYREYGVRLLFEPIVLGDGTIRLFASQEVSDLTDVGAVTIQGFRVPALITRKAETTLELNSGQTFAMAGLLKNKTGAVTSRIPGLGDLPILGPLFRSVRYKEEDTELVILVTAVLVEPMSLATTPPLPGFLHSRPNDWELYMQGRIEGKEPAKIDAASADWLKKMGLDDLFGPGAWDSYGLGASGS